MKRDGFATQELIESILQRAVDVEVMEDNTAAIQGIRNGYSPALRYIMRTQRINLGSLNEAFH